LYTDAGDQWISGWTGNLKKVVGSTGESLLWVFYCGKFRCCMHIAVSLEFGSIALQMPGQADVSAVRN
jgi:hypothetical protein